MPKAPDYEQKSQEILEKCEASEDSWLKAVREEIYSDLVVSVKTIKKIRDSSGDPALSLKAAREHLLLAGQYTEKHEHSGKVTFEPLKLSRLPEVADE